MELSAWSSLDQMAGAAVRTVAVYVFTVVAIRIAGRRTIAQMSAFDVVITVGLGTIAATTALPTSPALSDFATVLVTFLGLQVAVGALRQRSARLARWLDFRPEVIVRGGEVDLPRAAWTAQLTRADVESRLRQEGLGSIDEATVAVLEPTGRVSVTREPAVPPLFRDPGH